MGKDKQTFKKFLKRYENIQSNLWNLVRGGCLFFSILASYEDKFQETVDFIELFQWAISERKVSLDGTVNDSLAILNHIDGEKWKRLEVDTLLEIPKVENYFIVEKWEDSLGRNHFKPVGYDVYQDSLTVRTGKLSRYYIYYFE